MRLYYTPNSPYSRIASVALRDTGLAGWHEVEAVTRDPATGFFAVSPWHGCRFWSTAM